MKIKRKEFYDKFKDKLGEYDNIVIVPHNEIDLDALASSIGLYALMSFFKKNITINIDEENIELGVKRALEKLKKLKCNINIEKLKDINITNNTLIIILDFHKKDMAQNPEIFKQCNNIIVIDHHIEGRDSIGNALLKYIDDEASSTVEIIFDFLQINEINLPSYISTIMLAGLTLDTNNFTIKTGEKTHEVAAQLNKMGAISKEVQYLLKEDLSEYIEMQKIIFNTEIIDGIYAVTVGKKNEIYTKEQVAKIADSLLQFDEVEASFCICKINSNIVGISARSLGNVNVQKIMEKLNGGGHITDAACQMYNTTLIEAKKQLMKILDKNTGVIK